MPSMIHDQFQKDIRRVSQRLFLGQTLADTQGFGTVSVDYKRLAKSGWFLDQLLQMSAARADNSLG